MEKVVAAYQPRYYPRLHYLARAQQANVFIIYDDVQFSRQTPQHRAPIAYQDMDWLTIPVKHTGVETLINQATIDMSTPWIARHIDTLYGKYGSAASELRPFYESLLPSLLDPSYVRDAATELREEIGSAAASSYLDDFLELDANWRKYKAQLDNLKEQKNSLAESIAQRRSENPDADIIHLTEQVGHLDEKITTVQTQEQTTKKNRDQVLADLSEEVPEHIDAEWLPPRSLWELDGIDTEQVIGDVKLTELTIPTMEELFDRFNIDSQVVLSSNLPVEHPGEPSKYLARLTDYFDGDTYLSGCRGYENYVDTSVFDEWDIGLMIQEWEPQWKDGNVCTLDVLFNASEPSKYIR